MQTVSVLASAKINLILRVLGREPSGYHNIETLFQSVDLRDRITIELKGSAINLSCDNPNLPVDESNIAYKAAGLFLEKSKKLSGMKIEIEKKIPIAAGLGGGSADAAGVLIGLNHICDRMLTEQELLLLGSKLGADVPFAILGGTAWGWDRGQRLLCLPSLPECAVGLVFPGISILTKWAYENLAFELTNKKKNVKIARFAQDCSFIEEMHNDFEEPVFGQYPEIKMIREFLVQTGARAAQLSGTGSAVFGIYESDEIRDCSLRDCNEKFGYSVFGCSFSEKGIMIDN